VGNERHAFAIAKDLTPATSFNPDVDRFWRPWETFISSLRDGRSVH
jgi:hypothetical protein